MGDITTIVGSGPVLVLAPHPDDESLGCGALLAACWQDGIPAHVACLTDGAASHPGSAEWPPARLAAIRREELARAVGLLGGDPARDLTCLEFPDAGLHEVEAGLLVRALDKLIDRLSTQVLLSPCGRDPHCDHEAAFAAAQDVARRRPGLRLLTYPVWSRWVAGAAGLPPLPGARRHRFHAPDLRARKALAIATHASQCGRVVKDAPGGFAMPDGFAEMFLDGPEIFDERER